MKRTQEGVIFTGEDVLPAEWRALAGLGPIRTFNPALLRDGAGWIFAYRLVAADGLRRIAICRLDSNLAIVAGSPSPLTDQVRLDPGSEYPEVARNWFADPRLYRFGDRLFIYWNSGWHEPHNCQFLQELEPRTLKPVGLARELQLRGPRQKLEKNWTLFSEPASARTLAVYSIAPHRVLELSLAGEGPIACEEVSRCDWQLAQYPENHGGLRGGAPPFLADGVFWSFVHTVHDGPNGYRYLPAVYSFAAIPPFAPVSGPTRPLSLGDSIGAQRRYDRLNPAVAEVIYPCGAVRDGTRWYISHGINDECSAISWIEHADVCATLAPVRTVTRQELSG